LSKTGKYLKRLAAGAVPVAAIALTAGPASALVPVGGGFTPPSSCSSSGITGTAGARDVATGASIVDNAVKVSGLFGPNTTTGGSYSFATPGTAHAGADTLALSASSSAADGGNTVITETGTATVAAWTVHLKYTNDGDTAYVDVPVKLASGSVQLADPAAVNGGATRVSGGRCVVGTPTPTVTPTGPRGGFPTGTRTGRPHPGSARTSAPGRSYRGTVASLYAGKCLDATAAGGVAQVVKLQLWTCGAGGGENQEFAYTGGELRFVESGHVSGYCVSSVGVNQQAMLERCGAHGFAQQLTYRDDVWSFSGRGGHGNGSVLDDRAFGKANGTAVLTYAFNGGPNQRFSLPR
jgi:hypothetical protein